MAPGEGFNTHHVLYVHYASGIETAVDSLSLYEERITADYPIPLLSLIVMTSEVALHQIGFLSAQVVQRLVLSVPKLTWNVRAIDDKARWPLIGQCHPELLL